MRHNFTDKKTPKPQPDTTLTDHLVRQNYQRRRGSGDTVTSRCIEGGSLGDCQTLEQAFRGCLRKRSRTCHDATTIEQEKRGFLLLEKSHVATVSG